MIDIKLKLQLDSELLGRPWSQTRTQVTGGTRGYFVESNDTARWLEVALSVGADANEHRCGFYPVAIESKPIGVFILIESSENNNIVGRARPLPSQPRYGSAGASPSQAMNCLGKPIGNMFRAVASPSQACVMPMKSITLPKSMSSSQLWIPCESQISPTPLESDWPLLISGESEWLVWHPAFGLLTMDPLSRLEIESLIMAPVIVRSAWNRAVEGAAIPERLIRVDAPPPPSLEQWLDPSRNGIGDRPNDLIHLPPSQKESRGKPLENLGAMAKSAIGKTVAWIADRLDGSGKGSKKKANAAPVNYVHTKEGMRDVAVKRKASSNSQWIQDIRDWASKQMQKWNETLEARRESSVNRLLEMLDKNPDEGLRYAIPMSNDPGRGLASPGAELVARDLRWGASSSGGVDNWSLGIDAQRRLRDKYIELARREWNDGRFERAASIYAQLLSDYLLAAQALEKGKLYRQAAVVYEQRLNNRRKAAELCCLAGDFDLALEHYQALGLFLEAGELYQRLGQTELATAQFLKHVESLRNQNRPCDAADVLVNKLDRPDDAIELLTGLWPRGSQARVCAKKTFDLLSQLGRHESAIQQIDRMIADSGIVAVGVWPSELLADLVASYPDETVREHAQRSLFINASQLVRLLQEANSISAVTTSLCRAVPEDRLLQRDAHAFVEAKRRGFLEQPKSQSRALVALPKRDSVRMLEPTKTIALSREYDWFGMIPTQRGPLCFGEKDGTLLVQPTFEAKADKKADGRGGVEIRSFFDTQEVPRWLRYASKDTRQGEAITVMIGGGKVKAEFGAGTAYWIDQELSYRLYPASREVRDFFYPPGFFKASLGAENDHAVFLSSHLGQVRVGVMAPTSQVRFPKWPDKGGFGHLEQLVLRELRKTIGPSDLTEGDLANLVAAEMLSNKWCIASQDTRLIIGCGTQLEIDEVSSKAHITELPSHIASIRVSNPLTRPRVIIGLESGVLVHWMKADGYHSRVIDDSATNSHSCFVRTGHIAIAHDRAIDLYSNRGLELKHVGSFATAKGFADIAADQTVFWTLTKDGLVQKWDLTSFA